MSDGSLPPDPFEPQPDVWTPPPLRYPKDQPDIPAAASTGPRGRRKRKEKQKAVEEEPAELTLLEQLVAFTEDRSLQPSHRGQLLPGEAAGYKFLDTLRRCQQHIRHSPGLPCCPARNLRAIMLRDFCLITPLCFGLIKVFCTLTGWTILMQKHVELSVMDG